MEITTDYINFRAGTTRESHEKDKGVHEGKQYH